MAILVFIWQSMLLFSVTPCLCGSTLLGRRIKVIQHQIDNHAREGNV